MKEDLQYDNVFSLIIDIPVIEKNTWMFPAYLLNIQIKKYFYATQKSNVTVVCIWILHVLWYKIKM